MRELRRRRYLLLRRISQFSILGAFFATPFIGPRIAEGTLASSIWFGTLRLSDPFVLLQSLAAGHGIAASAIIGGLVVAAFYALVGGRVFCGWVCPINVVTDSARGLRRLLRWRNPKLLRLDKRLRYVILVGCLAGSFLSSVVVWELVNPINMVMRTVVFGLWMGGLASMVGIFLFDLLVMPGGWCGHICPVGAFYGVMGKHSVVQVAAVRREDCTNCGDCFEYCPEPQVIAPALRGIGGHGVAIQDVDCLRCGRCLDVCDANVFSFAAGGVYLEGFKLRRTRVADDKGPPPPRHRTATGLERQLSRTRDTAAH